MIRAIHEKEFSLLKYCDITKDHPILLDVMTNHRRIHMEELNLISEDYSRFFENIYPKVKNQLHNEWEGSLDQAVKEYSMEDDIRCDICKTKIKYAFTIKHKRTKKELTIGKECNKRFGILNQKDVNKAIQEREKLKRVDIIDRKYPNLLGKITNWNSIIDYESAYIPHFVKDDYIEIGRNLGGLHKEYISAKKMSCEKEDKLLKDIEQSLKLGDALKKDISLFIDKTKTSDFYPSKKVVDTLRTNGDNVGISWIEKNGLINAGTLFRVKDEEFAIKIIPHIEKAISNRGIKINGFQRYKNLIGYSITIEDKEDCKLFIKYEDLCVTFAEAITGEGDIVDFKIENLINDALLIDEYSIEYGLQLMENALVKQGIIVQEYFDGFNDVLWKVRKNSNSDDAKYFYLTKIKGIETCLKELLYNTKKHTSQDIYSLLVKNSNELYNRDAYELVKKRSRN